VPVTIGALRLDHGDERALAAAALLGGVVVFELHDLGVLADLVQQRLARLLDVAELVDQAAGAGDLGAVGTGLQGGAERGRRLLAVRRGGVERRQMEFIHESVDSRARVKM
jgi:hypothetical protein